MIQLVRDRRTDVIDPLFRGDGRRGLARLLAPDPEGKRKFDSSKWKRAKPQLRAETAGKCAYCEASTDAVAHGDVEHFRPKSVYWWLAYCYDNYLFACQICNQTYKGDRFPIRGSRLAEPPSQPDLTAEELADLICTLTVDPVDEANGLPYHEFEAACLAEEALLLNPYFADPAVHFAWEADDILKEVRLVARNPEAIPFVTEAELGYGLNREELRRVRFRHYRTLQVLKNAFDAPILPPELRIEVRENLISLMDAASQFAGMSRYFIREKWQLAI